MQWLKHAFAVEHPESIRTTAQQERVVQRICQAVVRRQLTTPALFALNVSRPLNYLGAQGLHFLSPLISTVVDTDGHKHLASFLEQRGSIDYICRRIEQLADDVAEPDQRAIGDDDSKCKAHQSVLVRVEDTAVNDECPMPKDDRNPND